MCNDTLCWQKIMEDNVRLFGCEYWFKNRLCWAKHQLNMNQLSNLSGRWFMSKVIPVKFNRGPESKFSNLLQIFTIYLLLWDKYFLKISTS